MYRIRSSKRLKLLVLSVLTMALVLLLPFQDYMSLLPPNRLVNKNYPVKILDAPPFNIDALCDAIWQKYQATMAQLGTAQDAISEPRVMMYVCRQDCGGLGDRLRGMTFVMVLAVLTDSIFVIESKSPIDLATVFPDISMRPRLLANNLDALMNRTIGGCQTRLNTFNYNTTVYWNITAALGQAPIVPFHTNELTWRALTDNPQLKAKAKWYGLDRLSTLDLFRLLKRWYLTRLSPRLHQQVVSIMHTMAPDAYRFKIGVQIRTGGDGWNDPERLPKSIGSVFATEVHQTCDGRQCAVFLTSDSVIATDIFRNRLQQLNPTILVVMSEGKPAHLDRMPDAAASEHEKTYIDWAILGLMDALVISRSGFGETAAWSNAIPTRSILGTERVIDYDSVIGHHESL